MKKLSILLMAVLIFALAGCQVKSPVIKTATNGNGSIAIDVQGNSPITPATKAPESELNAVVQIPPTPPTSGSDIFEIREKMFVAQTNDIYYNTGDYLGRTIKYEGLFQSYTWEENGVTYYSVIRYGPGCCGTDTNCGFEVIWDGTYPNADDWVECVGILEEYEEDGYRYLRLALTSLTVLDVRGAEYVTQ